MENLATHETNKDATKTWKSAAIRDRKLRVGVMESEISG